MDKPLAELGVKNGSQFDCDDYLQKFEIRIMLLHHEEFKSDDFEITTDPHVHTAKAENGVHPEAEIAESHRKEEEHKNGNKEGNGQPVEDGVLSMEITGEYS